LKWTTWPPALGFKPGDVIHYTAEMLRLFSLTHEAMELFLVIDCIGTYDSLMSEYYAIRCLKSDGTITVLYSGKDTSVYEKL
jgi:hypothetical protein